MRLTSRKLKRFVRATLDRYAEDRNHPDADATSNLSPYLHFGHISAHEVYSAVGGRDDENARAFLDQLLTWRELGYNFCFRRPNDYDRFSSLPDWARRTLAEHESRRSSGSLRTRS